MDEFDLLLRGDAFGGRPAAQPAGGATRGRRVAHAAVPGPDHDGPDGETQDRPDAGQYATSASPASGAAPAAGELPGFEPPGFEPPGFAVPPVGPPVFAPPRVEAPGFSAPPAGPPVPVWRAADELAPPPAPRPSWAPPVVPPPVPGPVAPAMPPGAGRPQPMTWVEPPATGPDGWTGPAPQVAGPVDLMPYDAVPPAPVGRDVAGVSMPGATPMPALPHRPGDEEQASKHAWMGPDGLVIPGYRSPSGA